MKRPFKPTRKNLPPNIVRTFEEIIKWHRRNGTEESKEYYKKFSLDKFLKQFWTFTNGPFTGLFQDSGKKYNYNFCSMVFYRGMLVKNGNTIFYNPINPDGKKIPKSKIPKKAWIGTPVVDALQPMTFKPIREEDKIFNPPIPEDLLLKIR